MDQIAQQLGVSKATISGDLVNCSIPEQLKHAKTATNPKGEPMPHTAKQLGVSQNTISLDLGNLSTVDKLKPAKSVTRDDLANLVVTTKLKRAKTATNPKGEPMPHTAKQLEVNKAQISRDLANCCDVQQLKHAKTATNPKGAGRHRGSSKQSECRMPEQQQLEAEIASLREENRRLHAIVGRAGIRLIGAPRDYPTAAEFDRLLMLALNRWPKLAEVPFDQLDASYKQSFRRSFLALCYAVGRSGKLDRSKYMSYWREIAEGWLRGQGYVPADLNGGAFVCAVICHGFEHSAPYGDPQNISMCAALNLGGDGSAHRPAAWKQILLAQRVPDPVKIVVSHVAAPRDIMVYGDPASFRADAWWRQP
jgi:hypothetical protein